MYSPLAPYNGICIWGTQMADSVEKSGRKDTFVGEDTLYKSASCLARNAMLLSRRFLPIEAAMLSSYYLGSVEMIVRRSQ